MRITVDIKRAPLTDPVGLFWVIENSQLGRELQKVYSFASVIKTPVDLLE